VKALLAAEGMGVLAEIDVAGALKKKLDHDRRPYVILGACHPPSAKVALEVEPAIGVFLPCNVDVFEGDDGVTVVQAVRAPALFAVLDRPELAPVAADVDARLARVLAGLPE
jgi:uncharacterized protein (DUF302 family)